MGLCQVLGEFGEAVETDLLLAGYRLDDLGFVFSWWDLLLLVRRFRTTPGSALQVATDGFKAPEWGEEFLAFIADAIANGNWQRGGGKGAKPKPLKRPWVKKPGTRLGSDPIPVHQFDEWWNSFS